MEALYESEPFTLPGLFTDGIEGPACDSRGRLYAVNFQRQGSIGVVEPDGTASLFLQLPQGSIGNGIRFRSDGTMLVADYTGHNILSVDMASRRVSILAHDRTMHQPNDICITARDVLFASDPDWERSTGRIWRLAVGGTLETLEEGMGTTNGIEIGPDERTLYVNESVQRRIWAYDLAPDGGASNKRLFHEFANHGLDGMRCDVRGCLYVTRYGKGSVAKLDPRGAILAEIPLHGSRPSNLAFGGPDGRTLYVTEVDHGRVESIRVGDPGREWALSRR